MLSKLVHQFFLLKAHKNSSASVTDRHANIESKLVRTPHVYATVCMYAYCTLSKKKFQTESNFIYTDVI